MEMIAERTYDRTGGCVIEHRKADGIKNPAIHASLEMCGEPSHDLTWIVSEKHRNPKLPERDGRSLSPLPLREVYRCELTWSV